MKTIFCVVRLAKSAETRQRLNLSTMMYESSHGPRGMFFVNANNVHQNTETHCYMEFRVLEIIKEMDGRLPAVLWMTEDNTGKENKSIWRFLFLASLVHRGIFQKIIVVYPGVGMFFFSQETHNCSGFLHRTHAQLSGSMFQLSLVLHEGQRIWCAISVPILESTGQSLAQRRRRYQQELFRIHRCCPSSDRVVGKSYEIFFDCIQSKHMCISLFRT